MSSRTPWAVLDTPSQKVKKKKKKRPKGRVKSHHMGST